MSRKSDAAEAAANETQGGANRTALVKQVQKSFNQYNQLENERAEINAGMGEIRARWKSMGLSVKGIKAGLVRAKLDADMRDLFDESYDLAADALNLPLDFTPDFFEDPDLFDPTAAEPTEEPDNEDGDGEETHLTDEEREAAARNGGVDLASGPGTEQDEGDKVLAAGLAETLGTTH